MPKAAAWCENGAVSAAGPLVELPESDRSKESGEAISRLHACDFPVTAGGALPVARVRDYPVAGINAQLEPEPLVPPAWPATRHDDRECRRSCPHREWPNFGTPL